MKYLTNVCVITLLIAQSVFAQIVEIPDPNLESAIREALQLPARQPITKQDMARLEELNAKKTQIVDLTGLEYAGNLRWLSLHRNKIRDITLLSELVDLDFLILAENPISDFAPLVNLPSLEYLDISGIHITDLTFVSNLTHLKSFHAIHCRISDITPLSSLTQLTWLNLSHNQIVDVSPLANLNALETLWIDGNWITDFSPLQGLLLTDFRYDEVCVLPDPPIQNRIENRSLPSIVQSWTDGLFNLWDELPALSHLALYDRIAYHDLYFHVLPFGLHFQPSPPWNQLSGSIQEAITIREELLAKNPNMLFLGEIRQRDTSHYPEDWHGWLRDESDNRVQDWHESSGREQPDNYLIDFRLPEVQDIIVEQAISVSKCGLYDGIFFDWWSENGGTLTNYQHPNGPKHYSTPEEERQARLTILQRIRANVPHDFLILCNSNRRKLPLSAPYINGNFMETFHREGYYTRDDIIEIETNLIWLEKHLRGPQINCLRGQGIPTEPPDSPNNRRWMRVFTTMSLTLSDGYALYVTGIHEQYQSHIWYPFWDANLGQPVSLTAQPYQNVEGVYIREFTNGWAVYNRSAKLQTITLPEPTIGVSSQKQDRIHLLPDLDGEIYLKSRSRADVNRDGKVNVLDLIEVSNGLGKTEPDVNGDGVVNILDLVLVSQQFDQ